MIETSFFQTMDDYASLEQRDVALDIGAGLGFLTRFLASKCRNVLAVEADEGLVKILRERLEELSNVRIINGNILKTQIPSFNKIVSIPPYQISSRLLAWLLNRGFDRAVLIFQKEFAKRLVASVGSKDYGWLTILCYYHAECELLDCVPKSAFYPRPQVDSIIVRLMPRELPPFTLKNRMLFAELIPSLFTQRNRKVRNAALPFLKGILARSAEDAVKIADALPFCGKRVRELAPEDLGAIANALSD
jgi:16S rRNA (adenine1518-N6/adenine1519-N6)-dimethyltransferase